MKITFLGTGMMGAGFVRALIERGHEVTVWNRTAQKAQALAADGAHVAADPGAAARGAERLYLSLSDDASVDEALAGALPALPADAIVVDLTTTAPLPTRARGARLFAAGRGYFHAPVFMTPDNARKAQGMMLGSGPEAVHARVEKDLAAMTGSFVYMGADYARAAAFKLFGNSMSFAIIGGLSDVFVMARAVGVDPADAVAFLTKLNPGRQIEVRGGKMARGDFTATFELSMARKDVRLAVETAAGDGGALAVLDAVGERMDELIAAGHGGDDLGALAVEALPRR
jgi:3-hydroxyisobutyrate dehydrogenase-like beta-hydroxyacid dehydrogenase